MLFVIKRNIYLLYALGLLQGMVFYAPVATLYRETQGVSIFEIALLESVSLVLCLVLEIPWGIAADRIGYKKTMVFCCGLYFVSKLVSPRVNLLVPRITFLVILGLFYLFGI